MKLTNIREALLELDRKTDARYDLTTLYEACKLSDDDKQQLVKYIDAYDHPATINKFLSSKCDAITEALGDDDVSDMKIIDEINDGGDRTLWSLMDKIDDEDLQLKELKEDVDPEVLQSRLEDIEYAMNTYAKDSFFIDNVEGSGTDWKVTYNGTTVDVVFDTEWDEYTYTINGKGPYSHSSYEYITKDIMDFVDYGHLGQSDDEVDEALGDNRDIHTRTHMDSYDVYCTDCGQVTSHKFKGNFKDGEKELGRYICKECGCENDDDPINESLAEGVDTSNLEPQIKEVVNAFMAEVGYEADEIEAYTAVEIKDTADDMIQVEVRAELGYDDLMELCDKLNPIVAALDHFAYFEPVTSGIARAFIRNDQSQDIVDEEAVNQWTNKIYDCASMEDLRQVWTAFKDHIDNGQYTDGTVDAVLDEIHKKADMLNESLTEDAKEEYFVGDDESGRIYYNDKDAQAAFDSLKKSGVANPVKMKVTDMREGLTEDYNKGEWVEVNLNTKKNGTPNIIPVKVEKELYHGRTFLGWAWGERQHEYPMSAIVKKIDMDDTDAIIRKYTPSGYMSEKLTLNESDDTDILYDMEDWDEDNTTVTGGNQFIEDGYTWMWFKQCGDTVHLDFDNWAVWWAYRREDEDDEDSAAISGFFVVDTDTGFIDWGPCDTVKEAQEFLQSKVNDWENDDLEESKSIKEEFNIQDYYNQTLNKFNNISSSIADDYDTFETGVELAIQDLTDEPNKSELFSCNNREEVKTFTNKLINTRKYDTLTVYPEVRSGYYDVIDYLNRLVNESKSIKEAFKDLDTFTQHCIEFYCDSGAADNEADQYCPGNPSKWDITDARFVDRAVEYYKESDYYDPDDWGHLDESAQDTVTRYQVEYFIDENDDSDTPLETYVYTDNKQEAIAKVKAEYPNAQIVYCVSETVPANYKEWDMKESIKEGVQPADEWYLKINPEDSEGAQELKGLFIDDVIKDKGNLDKYGFSDRLKGILDKEFERYSPMITEDVDSNLEAVANRLFNSLKEYGANKITKYVDVYQIYFNNSEDDSDATLVHYDIQSEGFKEVTQHGDEPNVTEYVNEDGTVCAKLLIYADAITVEVSAEDASQYNESFKLSDEQKVIVDEIANRYVTSSPVSGSWDSEATHQAEAIADELGISISDAKDIMRNYLKFPEEELATIEESIKESVEKYIIIAKEDGLNLYYNATDDNFGTDMKAATQYSERAVALDDYKAVKDRYPTAYIRSTYDIPLLNKPTTNEAVEDENIIAKKGNGDYLIKANSGWGYTAFNTAGVCIGGVTTDDEELAISKFMSGKLDEGFFGDIGKTIKAAGKEIADKTGISKVTTPVVDKAKEVAGKVKQKIDNTEAAKTFKGTETYKRIQDAKEVRGVIANIKAARSKEDIEKALAEIKALQKSGKLHTDGHMPYLMDLYKQRKRQLGLKVKKREGLEETDWSDDELASIYGGDTKYDMPDGVETPEETEARLAKEAEGNEV